MKAIKFLTITILAGLLFVGCAEESSTNTGTDITDGTSPVSTGSGTSSSASGGNIVNLELEGSGPADKVNKLATFDGRALNNPTNIKLQLNLVNRGNGNYGGKVAISYEDNGLYRSELSNGDTSQYLQYYDQAESAAYNKWFQKDGAWYFHGFFEDQRGAVVIVIDGFDDVFYGDGQAPSSYKGSVWYKNFSTTALYNPWVAPHGNQHCWFISEGPYDCRSWASGDDVNTYAAVEPNNGYIKLGTFTGLDVAEAFN